MIKDGGPAFPTTQAAISAQGGEITIDDPGMSLRAWLAGQALSGMMVEQLGNTKVGWQQEVAWAACSVADAVIAELEREECAACAAYQDPGGLCMEHRRERES